MNRLAFSALLSWALVSFAQSGGTGLILKYSTLIGGPGEDSVSDLAVDAAGNVHVVGMTGIRDAQAFVAKLNPAGTAWLLYKEFGGDSYDAATGVALDAAGNLYVVGSTESSNFPTTPGSYRPAPPGVVRNVFVVKLDPAGNVVWSTYLGPGTSSGIAVDAAGNAYVTGWTFDPQFPVTPGAFQATWKAANDVFVSKLNAQGSGLVYSTLIGGSSNEEASRIAVDASGSAYVTGGTRSDDFPTTPGVLQAQKPGPREDCFVAKLDPSGGSLVYSTFLGGTSPDGAFAIALNSQGEAFVTGITMSGDFPVTAGAFRNAIGGDRDGFLAKLSASAAQLIYSTFLGVAQGNAVAVNAAGEACIAGPVGSQGFPVTSGSLLPLADDYLACVNANGSGLLFATYLGTEWGTAAVAVSIDAQGAVYVGGTAGMNFPLTPGAAQTVPNGGSSESFTAADGFVAKIAEGAVAEDAVSSLPGASFFRYAPVAPESMVSAFGRNLAAGLEVAQSLPLPKTLGGVQVKLSDSAGKEALASLIAVSPTQINYIPAAGTASGPATVSVLHQGQQAASGTVQVDTVAPGLFTANANGQGAAAAVAVRVAPDGTQTSQLTFDCASGAGKCVTAPIAMGGPGDQVILLLFGTGIRGRTSSNSVRLLPALEQFFEIQYAGPQKQYPGLDQINVRVKASPGIPGDFFLRLFVDGRPANPISIRFQ